MITTITFTDSKDVNNKITGFTANFSAVEGSFTSTSSVSITLGAPVDSLSTDERIKKLDMNAVIKSLKDDLITKGATITKMTISI
jgi:hypothetical protein